jgi:uncharacterized membrane protein
VGKKKWPGWQSPIQTRPVQTTAGFPATAELTLQHKSYTGPLPPPEDLKEYDQVSVGLANRIVEMAEREQQFRHSDTITVRKIQEKVLPRGQIFGFILSLVIILGGILLIMSDKPTSGFISILAGIATVAGPYFYRVHHEKKQQA